MRTSLQVMTCRLRLPVRPRAQSRERTPLSERAFVGMADCSDSAIYPSPDFTSGGQRHLAIVPRQPLALREPSSEQGLIPLDPHEKLTWRNQRDAVARNTHGTLNSRSMDMPSRTNGDTPVAIQPGDWLREDSGGGNGPLKAYAMIRATANLRGNGTRPPHSFCPCSARP